MKKFIYRMQGILNIKYKIEEQEKINYAIAMARLAEAGKALEQLLYRQLGYEEELRGKVNDRLMIHEIIALSQAVEIMKDLVKAQRLRVKREEQLTEAARIRLNAAMTERKTQEKLKENAFDEYKLEFEAEERKEIDELVSYKYSSNMSG